MSHIRYQTTLLWVGALCAGALAFPALGASFDCSRATATVERWICGNGELSGLDDELYSAYRAALMNTSQADATRREQRAWLKLRNSCKDVNCVRNAYTARLTVLRVTSDGEYGGRHGGGTYVQAPLDMDKEVFEHENTNQVCALYLQNLQYFATRQLPMSCGQPIAPQLRSKIEEIEWQDLDPEKYPELFKKMVEDQDADSRQPVVTDEELSIRRDEVRKKEYLFRRAKITLLGHPIPNDPDLSQWARDYANQHQGRTPPEIGLTIVQYGADINSADNPSKAWRCNVNQIRGAEYSPGLFYELVTDDLQHVYGDIEFFSTAMSPRYLWRIDGRLYGEAFAGGDVQLSEFGGVPNDPTRDVFSFEPVCLYHHVDHVSKEFK